MEFSPFVGPDSLRETTRLLKNLYDLHTKRYCGYEDINGSQYVGTVENFGSEQLIESRKILMDKPSLKNIFIENTFDFYFDIQYSGSVNTYDQQNMLSAVLKKDVLLSNETYRIRFDNVEISNVPRSKSSSDPNVIKDYFLHTETSPHLVIESTDGSIEEKELRLSDKDGINGDYYFHIDHETIDMFDESELDDIINTKTFITKPITDNMYGRELVWICVNVFKLLPNIGFVNNELNGVKLFTLGMNGHDNILMYPLINHNWESLDNHYLIKVIPIDSDAFIETGSEINFNTKVGEIQILHFGDNKNVDPRCEPDSIIKITYDQKYSKITLFNFDQTKNPGFSTNIPYRGKWYFRKPVQGDYDYDGKTYHNRCYAYTSLSSFSINTSDNPILIAAMSVKFDDAFLHEYEGLNENACSGIHIDVTSDHSDNGVSKKNGVIYSMGEFDGLPKYFKYMIDDTIHRAHVEAYAIRDKINDVNQLPNEKQTAGIIIDSAIPQNEVQKVTENMVPVICFDMNNFTGIHYKYYPEKDEGLSKSNYLSEICYIDDNHMGNSNIVEQSMYPKFVYHGNRHFSLGLMGFDPELEVGRVYIISNDKAVYENNETTDTTKAPITFARICDIPTDFSQLVNNRETSPTLVIDPEYVRMIASFDTDDKDAMYNRSFQDKLIRFNGMIVLHSNNGMDVAMVNEMNEQYPQYIRLNEMIDISDTDHVKFELHSSGEGYELGDEFLFYIGGLCIKGVVNSIDTGTVNGIVYKNYDNEGNVINTEYPILQHTLIARSNFENRVTTYETKTVSGNGFGLTVMITISPSIWDNTGMTTNGHLEDCFYFAKDVYDNIWAYTYDETASEFNPTAQITGCEMFPNVYDPSNTLEERTLLNTFMYNMLTPIDTDVSSTPDISCILSNIRKDEEDIMSDYDFSYKLNLGNFNNQDSLFILDTGYETSNFHNIIRIEYGGRPNASHNQMKHPAYSDLSYYSYYNKTNRLLHAFDDTQPMLFIFDPTSPIAYYNEEVICKDMVDIGIYEPLLISAMMPTLTDIVDASGTLKRNIYISDEFNTSDHDKMIEELNVYTRDGLINYLKENFNDAYPLRFENTDYAFSKEMLINYIMKNTLRWGRAAGYTDGPESLYRLPEIRLFRKKGEQVQDKAGRPIGDQPKGMFKCISNEKFDKNVNVDKASHEASPLFIFRLDVDEENISLEGFRLYDEMNKDISEMSLLIVNDKKYVFHNNKGEGTFGWICLNKTDNETEENKE